MSIHTKGYPDSRKNVRQSEDFGKKGYWLSSGPAYDEPERSHHHDFFKHRSTALKYSDLSQFDKPLAFQEMRRLQHQNPRLSKDGAMLKAIKNIKKVYKMVEVK